jgi:hypothetical protein
MSSSHEEISPRHSEIIEAAVKRCFRENGVQFPHDPEGVTRYIATGTTAYHVPGEIIVTQGEHWGHKMCVILEGGLQATMSAKGEIGNLPPGQYFGSFECSIAIATVINKMQPSITFQIELPQGNQSQKYVRIITNLSDASEEAQRGLGALNESINSSLRQQDISRITDMLQQILSDPPFRCELGSAKHVGILLATIPVDLQQSLSTIVKTISEKPDWKESLDKIFSGGKYVDVIADLLQFSHKAVHSLDPVHLFCVLFQLLLHKQVTCTFGNISSLSYDNLIFLLRLCHGSYEKRKCPRCNQSKYLITAFINPDGNECVCANCALEDYENTPPAASMSARLFPLPGQQFTSEVTSFADNYVIWMLWAMSNSSLENMESIIPREYKIGDRRVLRLLYASVLNWLHHNGCLHLPPWLLSPHFNEWVTSVVQDFRTACNDRGMMWMTAIIELFAPSGQPKEAVFGTLFSRVCATFVQRQVELSPSNGVPIHYSVGDLPSLDSKIHPSSFIFSGLLMPDNDVSKLVGWMVDARVSKLKEGTTTCNCVLSLVCQKDNPTAEKIFQQLIRFWMNNHATSLCESIYKAIARNTADLLAPNKAAKRTKCSQNTYQAIQGAIAAAEKELLAITTQQQLLQLTSGDPSVAPVASSTITHNEFAVLVHTLANRSGLLPGAEKLWADLLSELGDEEMVRRVAELCHLTSVSSPSCLPHTHAARPSLKHVMAGAWIIFVFFEKHPSHKKGAISASVVLPQSVSPDHGNVDFALELYTGKEAIGSKSYKDGGPSNSQDARCNQLSCESHSSQIDYEHVDGALRVVRRVFTTCLKNGAFSTLFEYKAKPQAYRSSAEGIQEKRDVANYLRSTLLGALKSELSKKEPNPREEAYAVLFLLTILGELEANMGRPIPKGRPKTAFHTISEVCNWKKLYSSACTQYVQGVYSQGAHNGQHEHAVEPGNCQMIPYYCMFTEAIKVDTLLLSTGCVFNGTDGMHPCVSSALKSMALYDIGGMEKSLEAWSGTPSSYKELLKCLGKRFIGSESCNSQEILQQMAATDPKALLQLFQDADASVPANTAGVCTSTDNLAWSLQCSELMKLEIARLLLEHQTHPGNRWTIDKEGVVCLKSEASSFDATFHGGFLVMIAMYATARRPVSSTDSDFLAIRNLNPDDPSTPATLTQFNETYLKGTPIRLVLHDGRVQLVLLIFDSDYSPIAPYGPQLNELLHSDVDVVSTELPSLNSAGHSIQPLHKVMEKLNSGQLLSPEWINDRKAIHCKLQQQQREDASGQVSPLFNEYSMQASKKRREWYNAKRKQVQQKQQLNKQQNAPTGGSKKKAKSTAGVPAANNTPTVADEPMEVDPTPQLTGTPEQFGLMFEGVDIGYFNLEDYASPLQVIERKEETAAPGEQAEAALCPRCQGPMELGFCLDHSNCIAVDFG